MPKAAAKTRTSATTAAPISLPLWRWASAINRALDEGECDQAAFAGELAEAGECMPEEPGCCVTAACTEAEDAPEAESAGDLPDSVSRFSRFRSARMSDAC